MTTLNSSIQLALSNSRQAKKKKNQGFTLIELLITVVILGVLSAIALPAFLNQQNRAVASSLDSAAMSEARACAALQVTAEHGDAINNLGTCNAAGTTSTFTAADDVTPKRASDAVATVAADGSATLVASIPN